MSIFEWLLVILVSGLIFFIGFAGVTGSYFFDKQKSSKNTLSSKTLDNKDL
ncbi:MAG: hypothetical protein HWD86_11305 [Kangiellaceae bacterium]|nr:hypothetical protein [Kangiellaceae bacterium]